MPNTCSAINCKNRANSALDISFYRFPLRDKELTKKWVFNMKRKDWYPTKSSCLCSVHFENKFVYYTNDQRRLLNSAVPTLFSFPQHLQKEVTKRAPPKKRHLSETDPAEIPDPAVQPDAGDLPIVSLDK
ncbi:THAP domain-containing protein 5 [Anabrus simplex]|uniref:THAP domain-containing protein 5 n=1 Tax=Anabrus simplex TaxID=316456 RepID=UPI0035A3D27C